MSSSRTTKRKRSKAGAPATSSTRERAAAEEPARTDTEGKSAAEDEDKNDDVAPSISITTTSTGNGSDTDVKASDDVSGKGNILDSKQSAEKGGTKNEANVDEPINNGKSAESDKVAAKSPTEKIEGMTPATMLSIDASSSSTSSQDGTSTRRQALHVANDDDDREKRMIDLISHRSILLDRIRTCRESAENRIGEKSDGGINKVSADDLADEQEIAAFRSMTKQANQAARKTREAEGTGEKRTSISLRRGNSVGKRMNAALSSLVPGSNITSMTSGVNNASGQSTTIAAAKSSSISNPQSAEYKAEAKGASPLAKYTTTKSSGRLPINSLSNDPSATTTQTSTSIKSNKNHSPFPSQTTKQYDIPGRGRPPNSKNMKMMKTGGTQMGPGAPHTLASTQNLKKNASLPMGIRSGSMMPSGPNSFAAKQRPRVNFPEAIALREKRDQIESKLRSLMERRQSNASLTSGMMSGGGKIIPSSSFEDDITRRKATPGGVGITKPISNSKKLLHPSMRNKSDSGLGISSPGALPNRRRTHWDVVLQEMSWLASDFIEERKWKLSTSRLLSSSIPPHGLSDRRKRASEANRGGNDNTPRDLPADTSSDNNGASSNDAPESLVSKKGDACRKYSVPVTDDEEMAKCRSQILSCMISQLDAAIKKGGSLENSDKHHQEALRSFAASRADIIRKTKDPIAKDFDSNSDASKDENSDESADETSDDKSGQKESHFENIDDYIEHFHSICKSKHKLAAKETAKALKSGKIKLTSKQKEMLEFVDKLWSRKPHSGAVISGSSISGITFGTATTIWKQRTQGSQILICPSRSLIRWKYELSRFSSIRVLTFGSNGGISNPDDENNVVKLVPADVILCEYTSVSRMKNALKKMGENPFSVIVDLRHFASLRKSLGASTSPGGDDFPSELLSNRWWGDIVALVKSREIRCLLLEYYDADPLSLSLCGLGPKEQISILAKRAACIIGPEVFASGSHSIEREVITWARRKGKNEITDKASRVRKILHDAVKPMSFHVTKSVVSSFDLNWELRSCTMSKDQREEYERCCNEVRGALSSSIEVSNSNRYHYSISVVSNALFRLRQECFYSRKHAMQSFSPLHNESPTLVGEHQNRSKKKSSNFWANSSQPDADRANSILNSSSKLKELISILTSEGGYNLDVDESTKKMFGISRGTKKGKDTKRPIKKIVILVSLPTIQHVVSTLLNSLGIQNEELCRYDALPENGEADETRCPKLDTHTKKYEAIAWAKSQTVLSRFCCDNNHRKTNIIIASPAVLSGRNDGIGVEGADMIITLDSDWSGRDGFIVESLVKRWHAKNKLAGKEDRLIRLVSADSIEENIFDDDNGVGEVLSWPIDTDGFFTIPISQDEASALYSKLKEDDSSPYYPFPATGVLQNRGLSLEDVLSSSIHLPSLFGSGKPSVFLPRSPDLTDQEISGEIHFLKCFLQNEKFGSISMKSTTLIKPTYTSQMSFAGLISRNDMSVIESRLFLEKLINSYSVSKDREDNPLSNALHSNVLLLNATQSPGESSNSKADENPSSLLFYEPYQDSLSPSNDALSKNGLSKSVDENVGSKTKRRCNAYARLFSGSWNGISLRDGNQGCEPLVFFPPLFPGLAEVSKKARIKHISSGQVTAENEGTVTSTRNTELSSEQKRKDRDFATTRDDIQHDSKRPKTQSVSNQREMNGHSGLVSSFGNKLPETLSKDPSNSKNELVVQNGKATIISSTSPKGPNTTKSCSSGLVMAGEDFGLLGTGAFPTPSEATSISAYDSKVNSSYTVSSSNILPCDAEEVSTSALKPSVEGMQSVLLFVRKRPRATQTAYKHSQGLSNIVPLPIGSKAAGDDSVKKIKKRGAQGNTPLPPTAFTRLPGNAGAQHSQIISRTSIANSRQVKGDFRHKLLASFYARQRATGLTLFDSIPYRVAAMRVEKRVMERLEKLMWKSTLALDAGPGLPIQFVEKAFMVDKYRNDHYQDLTSIVDELKDGSSTGSAAKAQSSVQKLEFKRSSVSPRCVDFGAFEVGYLSSPSGMTGMPTTRRRVGVSLPMGVRLMKPTKDQEKRFAWNVRDDVFLREAAKKFGTNWLLVASATSGFEHAVILRNLPGIENTIPAVAKSARQCRDRWQQLVQSQPSLDKEVQNSENLFRERTFSSSKTVHDIKESKMKSKVSVYSAENINIICKTDESLDLSEESASTTDIHDDQKDGAKQENVASPRSTVDKQDDDAANGNTLMQVVNDNTNGPSSTTEDAQMPDALKTTKPKRRSFSAIANARSRRQIFPVTIPGIDVGGNQPGHPVPSHPSHMQSVQISVAAQWASGRTEMWPLQILDLADKQKSSASRINNMQRGEIPPVHNSSRRHPTSSSSYQHRSQPPQSTAVRAPVGYAPGMNTASRPVAPRPVNPSVTPHHQHRSPPVAPATVQAYIPPPTAGKPKKNEKQKPTNKSSPKKG